MKKGKVSGNEHFLIPAMERLGKYWVNAKGFLFKTYKNFK